MDRYESATLKLLGYLQSPNHFLNHNKQNPNTHFLPAQTTRVQGHKTITN